MKKLLTFILCLIFVFALSACGSSIEKQENTDEEYEQTYSEEETNEESEEDNTYTSTYSSESSASKVTNFVIEGKWKSVGDTGYGQAQPGSIVVFDGANCNFFSPKDTYAFYYNNGKYTLDCTSYLFSQNLSFDVEIIDNDNIVITYGSTTTKLLRVG